MSDEEISKCNKLIAKFMGGIFKISEEGFKYCELPNEIIDAIKHPLLGSSWTGMNFMFHKSWDWLIPIVERIESIGVKVTIIGNSCNIKTFISGYDLMIIGENKLHATYQGILAFIKWQNNKYDSKI